MLKILWIYISTFTPEISLHCSSQERSLNMTYSGTCTYERLYLRTIQLMNSSVHKILLLLANGASRYEQKKAGENGGQFKFLTVGGTEAASLCCSSFNSCRVCCRWRLGRDPASEWACVCFCREVSCCFLLLKTVLGGFWLGWVCFCAVLLVALFLEDFFFLNLSNGGGFTFCLWSFFPSS